MQQNIFVAGAVELKEYIKKSTNTWGGRITFFVVLFVQGPLVVSLQHDKRTIAVIILFLHAARLKKP